MSAEIEAELWRFAVEFYNVDGVSDACLILQDEAQADIIHLLVVLYCQRALHAPLSADEIVRLREEMASWQYAVVLPLREIRRSMKRDWDVLPAASEAFRQKVKQLELQAERFQISIASCWLARRAPRSGLKAREAFVRLLNLSAGARWQSNGKVTTAIELVIDAADRFSFWRYRPAT